MMNPIRITGAGLWSCFAIQLLAVALLAALGQLCHGQHAGDVLFDVEDGQLTILNRVTPGDAREFDVNGDGTTYLTNDPGYNTVGFGTLNANDEVHFEVVSPLLAWSSELWAPAVEGEYLRYYDPPLPDVRSVTATGTTGALEGYLLQRASALGAIHVHDFFELGTTSGGAPQAGAYAIGKRLISPNYGESEPYYIVLNNGMSTELFDRALLAADISFFPIDGDIDRDGDVDLGDFNLLKANFGRTGVGLTEGDITSDGAVDLADFNVLKENFGELHPAVSPVPEPSTAAITILLATMACVIRKRLFRTAWSHMLASSGRRSSRHRAE